MKSNIFKVLDITEKSRIEGTEQHEPSLTNEQLCIIFAVCHAIGMLSACANPIIYGFLNKNFHREFVSIFNCIRETISRRVYCTTESEMESSPANVTNETNQNNQYIPLLMRYDVFRCCRKRQTNCCRNIEESSTLEHFHFRPLSVLGNNQKSVSNTVTTSNTAINSTSNVIFAAGKKAPGESNVCLKKTVLIKEQTGADITLEESTFLRERFPKNDLDKENADETEKLLEDKCNQEVAVLVTTSSTQSQES